MPPLKALPRCFYDRDVGAVARELLGKRLARRTQEGLTVGRIVEVEAYRGKDDPASHSFRGLTKRNATMFGPPGHAYVYSIHAKHCVNAVAEAKGTANAVLIRSLEPLAGEAIMRGRRNRERPVDWTRGPARLCQAMAIDRQLDGCDLTVDAKLWIADDPDFKLDESSIVVSPRIGISQAVDLPLRFFIAENRFVSRPRFHLKFHLKRAPGGA